MNWSVRFWLLDIENMLTLVGIKPVNMQKYEDVEASGAHESRIALISLPRQKSWSLYESRNSLNLH